MTLTVLDQTFPEVHYTFGHFSYIVNKFSILFKYCLSFYCIQKQKTPKVWLIHHHPFGSCYPCGPPYNYFWTIFICSAIRYLLSTHCVPRSWATRQETCFCFVPGQPGLFPGSKFFSNSIPRTRSENGPLLNISPADLGPGPISQQFVLMKTMICQCY